MNGVSADVNDNLFVAENVPLSEGSNTLTATATDNGGNTTETDITVTLDPQASITYTYDDNGNMTSKTVDGETTTYTYDYDNRLIAINNGLSTISYVYDPFGRRIEKNVNGTVTRYIYNGSQIIQETDSAGTIEATYVYGLGIDEPIIMERSGTSYYYYFDGLGSVTEITDSSANIVERYKYDPFGETTILDPSTETVRDSSSMDNFYMYTGRQLDEETGLYYYRNRYYDTAIGRFITSDPIGYKGGFNLYKYVNNNPINLIDPSGTVVRLCDVDDTWWRDILNFTHTFIEVYSRLDKTSKFELLSPIGFNKVNSTLEVKEKTINGRRYIICYNPEEAEDEAWRREYFKKILSEKIDKNTIKDWVIKNGYKKYINITGAEIKLNEDRLRKEAIYDGKWILLTNTDFPSRDISFYYKGLWRIERGFRSLKTELETAPVYHWTEPRIRAHIYICFLALVMRIGLEKRIRAINSDLNFSEVVMDLAKIKATKLKINNEELIIRTDLTGDAHIGFKAVNMRVPNKIIFSSEE